MLLGVLSPVFGLFLSPAERENAHRVGLSDYDPYSAVDHHQQHQRAASYVFSLCASEAWVLLLLWMGGSYTPTAALLAVPAAAAIRCFIKNFIIDWLAATDTSSSSSSSTGYTLADSSSSSSSSNYKEMIRPYLSEALRAPNFFGLPDGELSLSSLPEGTQGVPSGYL